MDLRSLSWRIKTFMLAAHEKAQKNRGQGWTCKSIRGQGTDQMGRSSGKGPEDSSDAFSFGGTANVRQRVSVSFPLVKKPIWKPGWDPFNLIG